MSRDDKERHGRMTRLFVFEVVQSKDIMGGTINLANCLANGGWAKDAYHTRCRPLGIAFTAVTGPLPWGNLNTRSGVRRPL